MTSIEALIKGRDFLQDHKWGRDDYHNVEKNTYCVVGSLYCGTYGESYWEDDEGVGEYSNVWDAERYLNKVAPSQSATSFNDRKAKRKRDVISLYNKAIKLAQEESNDTT